MERLGAVACRYNINQYGISSSPLQGGLPTDRLVAEWWLTSKRVNALLPDRQLAKVSPKVTIDVPAQIYEWKASEEGRDKAKEVQLRNRDKFLKAFREGLSVLGYERDKAGNGRFLLTAWDEHWGYDSAPGEEEVNEER